MFEKLLAKLVQRSSPSRDYSVIKVGKHFFKVARDTVGCNDYLLEGKYSYDEVVALNALTTHNASFGYCDELGPVAFIGIPNPQCVGTSGYFKYNVHEYGTPLNESEYYFKAYTLEEAKEIKDYTVYGMRCSVDGFDQISKMAKISKICYFYDSRYNDKRKHRRGTTQRNRVYDMDCKLSGTYDFYAAKRLATGTIRKKEGYSGDEHPIFFATVGENYHVGIINFWQSDTKLMVGFRDVWEYGVKEPEIQTVRLLSDEEARKINNFVLYIYDYSFVGRREEKYPIEKRDRTLDNRFNFHLADGTDYRLVEHNELLRSSINF